MPRTEDSSNPSSHQSHARPGDDVSRTEPVQADPQLQLSEGRASGIQITVVAIACMLIVSLMIYGLNRPATEDIAASGPPAAQTTGNAAPAAEPAAQTGGNVAGGEKAPPPNATSSQDIPAREPTPHLVKPGVVGSDAAR